MSSQKWLEGANMAESNLVPVAEQQASKSFVKAYADWVNIGKMHLSFVSHTGRASGCNPVASIEAALPIYHGSGKLVDVNGRMVPEDNTSGLLKLVLLVQTNALAKMLAKSRQDAVASGVDGKLIYASSVFEIIGGSAAKVKNGTETPIRYRKISVAPSGFYKNQPNESLVLQIMECDGDLSQTGGYVPKTGQPNSVRINVQFKYSEFAVFVMSMHTAWQAEMTRRAFSKEKEFFNWRENQEKEKNGYPNPSQQLVKSRTVAPVADVAVQKNLPSKVIVSYDSVGITFTVASIDSFEKVMRNSLREMLRHEKKYVVTEAHWTSLLSSVKRGEANLPCIVGTSKVNGSQITITSLLKEVQ